MGWHSDWSGGVGSYDTVEDAIDAAGWQDVRPDDLPPTVQALRLKSRIATNSNTARYDTNTDDTKD